MEYQNLSQEAKDSLKAMVDYCLRHGIAMGMDEGYECPETGKKHDFRVELEAFCESKD